MLAWLGFISAACWSCDSHVIVMWYQRVCNCRQYCVSLVRLHQCSTAHTATGLYILKKNYEGGRFWIILGGGGGSYNTKCQNLEGARLNKGGMPPPPPKCTPASLRYVYTCIRCRGSLLFSSRCSSIAHECISNPILFSLSLTHAYTCRHQSSGYIQVTGSQIKSRRAKISF